LGACPPPPKKSVVVGCKWVFNVKVGLDGQVDILKSHFDIFSKVAQSKLGIVISQRKYDLDILEEIYLIDCKLVDTLMYPNIKLLPNQGRPYILILVDIEDEWKIELSHPNQTRHMFMFLN
jgi:hypothetical protein